MFDRTRYNWATTKVEASCKFDFQISDEGVEKIKEFLASDEFFNAINEIRKAQGQSWAAAIGGGAMTLAKQSDEEGFKILCACIFAGAAKNLDDTKGISNLTIFGDSFELCGLERPEGTLPSFV